jgi:hypothetical protein
MCVGIEDLAVCEWNLSPIRCKIRDRGQYINIDLLHRSPFGYVYTDSDLLLNPSKGKAAAMEPSQQLQNCRRSIMKVNRQSNVSSPRRHRAILSCATCRKRKIRCDRLTPCSRCVKSKIAESCYYPVASTTSSSPVSAAPPPRVPVQVQPSRQYIATPPTPTTERSCDAHDLGHLQSQGQISDEVPRSSNFPNASLPWPSSIDPIKSLPSLSFRGKDQKTRFFGRSHWAITLSMVRCYLRLHGFTRGLTPNWEVP